MSDTTACEKCGKPSFGLKVCTACFLSRVAAPPFGQVWTSGNSYPDTAIYTPPSGTPAAPVERGKPDAVAQEVEDTYGEVVAALRAELETAKRREQDAFYMGGLWVRDSAGVVLSLKPEDIERESARRYAAPPVPDKQRELYQKFIVTRTDGRSAEGEKHHGCEYFVLDCNHDKHAVAALLAYAKSAKDERPELSRDLETQARVVALRTDNVAALPTHPAPAVADTGEREAVVLYAGGSEQQGYVIVIKPEDARRIVAMGGGK